MVIGRGVSPCAAESVADRVRRTLLTRCFRLLWLAAIMLSAQPAEMEAQAPSSKEYQVKSAFLFNFAQFVEWPAKAFSTDTAPFCIGILGNDPFGKALDETIQGETIQNRKLIVKRSQKIEDLMDCQLIFISKSEKNQLPDILAKLSGHQILTVGELPGFATHGGGINFFLEGNKVRFEINPAPARREGLKISSQLLSLGKIVEPEAASSNK